MSIGTRGLGLIALPVALVALNPAIAGADPPPPSPGQLGEGSVLVEGGPAVGMVQSGPVPTWRLRVRSVADEPGPGGVDAVLVPAADSYYENPLRDVHRLKAYRIDEGVDYGGSGPVKALGPATVTVIERGTSVFWADVDGNVVVEQLDTGPLIGLSIYTAENCTPNKELRVGDEVTAETTLCRLHNHFPYLETGFSEGAGSDFPAAWPVYQTVPDGSKTAYGLDFSELLGDLGAPQGNSERDLSYHPSVTVGTLPPGFPDF